ncbi:transposase [Funiculus sociatus]|uniref:transposase n=1 Tax=Funiculus sociatus TaxID=450527 RepID=UPI003D65BCFD
MNASINLEVAPEDKACKKLFKQVQRRLQYLPPYSPDLNEIEHYWFPIKNRVRKSIGTIENFRERVDTSVRLAS